MAAIQRAWGRRPVNLAKPVIVPLGRYLTGFADRKKPAGGIECQIDERYYTFVSRDRHELGKIPRAGIVDVFCDVKGSLLPHLTSTRNMSFASLGINPKKPKPLRGYCLVVDWRDPAGERHNVVFEYKGWGAPMRARRAESTLLRFRKPHIEPPRADQKKCPDCAEPVRIEAKICRHCKYRFDSAVCR